MFSKIISVGSVYLYGTHPDMLKEVKCNPTSVVNSKAQ